MMWLVHLLLDLLFPGTCVSCGEPVLYADNHICRSCFPLFDEISDGCTLCSGIIKDGICTICDDREFYAERHISLFRYEKSVKSAIHALKFNRLKGVYSVFVPFICKKMSLFGNNIDIITSVPMSRGKTVRRGYNQSRLIARSVGEKTGIKYFDLLREKKGAGVQRSLNYNERFINVIDRYQTVNNNKISGRSILLIDDVFTTGATINECSRMLLKAGASRVFALTVVRSDLKKLENV